MRGKERAKEREKKGATSAQKEREKEGAKERAINARKSACEKEREKGA